ncbi:MAG: SoxR reducing system RseC family protein [Bacteroidaceae bacterium]|nr:SoxR reducing system RseC family protein [Bacteroidaceae bacterium]
MSLSKTIVHEGVVREVRPKGVVVGVVQSSACSSCAAARLCRSSESRERLIDVATPHASAFRAGQEVTLVGSVGQSRTAVVVAYVLPLVLLLLVLFGVHALTSDDALAALAALLFVGLYYGVLYGLRGRLSSRFCFDVSARSDMDVNTDNN